MPFAYLTPPGRSYKLSPGIEQEFFSKAGNSGFHAGTTQPHVAPPHAEAGQFEMPQFLVPVATVIG